MNQSGDIVGTGRVASKGKSQTRAIVWRVTGLDSFGSPTWSAPQILPLRQGDTSTQGRASEWVGAPGKLTVIGSTSSSGVSRWTLEGSTWSAPAIVVDLDDSSAFMSAPKGINRLGQIAGSLSNNHAWAESPLP